MDEIEKRLYEVVTPEVRRKLLELYERDDLTFDDILDAFSELKEYVQDVLDEIVSEEVHKQVEEYLSSHPED